MKKQTKYSSTACLLDERILKQVQWLVGFVRSQTDKLANSPRSHQVMRVLASRKVTSHSRLFV